MANIFRPGQWLRSWNRYNEEGEIEELEVPIPSTPNAAATEPNLPCIPHPPEMTDSLAIGRRSPSEEVERLAYSKWVAAGCPKGQYLKFWLDAEKECLEK